MDVQLGRWHVVDAMAEKYLSTSPYAYVMNNPISYKDFMGLQANGNFGDWYAQGGRAGMSLGDYAGKIGTTYVPVFGTASAGSVSHFGFKGKYLKGLKRVSGDVSDFISNNVKFHSSFDGSLTLGLQGTYLGVGAGFAAHELVGVHAKTDAKTNWYYSGKGHRNKTKHYISIPFLEWTQDSDTPTNWYMNQDVTTTNTFQLEITGFILKVEFDGNMNYNNTYLGVGYSTNLAALLGFHINGFTGFKF